MKNETKTLELPPEESIILEKKANKKKNGFNYIGGKITLTNGAVYFKPQKLTTSNSVSRVALSDIHVLRKARSLMVVPNRMIIGDKQGTEHIFVVSNRNAFYDAVESQLSNKKIEK